MHIPTSSLRIEIYITIYIYVAFPRVETYINWHIYDRSHWEYLAYKGFLICLTNSVPIYKQ